MQNQPLYLSAPLTLDGPESPDSTLPLKFSGQAYSGGVVEKWDYPIVIDLASTTLPDSIPLLLEHDREDIIGVVDRSEKTDSVLTVAGSLFSDIDEDAAMLAKKAQRGLQCQMSVGLFGSNNDMISAGNSVNVNGREFQGPCTVLRNGTIREVSIVALGADANTNAKFFSALAESQPTNQDQTMPEVNPLQAEVDALKTQVSDLTARLADAEAKATAAETAKVEIELAARKSDVAALFASIGRECTDAAMEPYTRLSADAWDLLKTEMKAMTKTVPEYLFSAQATGTTQANQVPSLNPADIYAARRAN